MKDIDLIHISSGIICPSMKKEIKKICSLLYKEKIFIVSSFDNEGAISYPACLPEVIGVQFSLKCKKINDYIVLNNSNINILGFGGKQLLPWKDGNYKNVSGSSFASPYITIKILDLLNLNYQFEDIFKQLKKDAINIMEFEIESIEQNANIDYINDAAIFPLNKETIVLLENKDLLDFNIKYIFDVNNYYNERTVNNKRILGAFKLFNINQISKYNDFDTLIVGRLDKINQIFNYDYTKYLLDYCYVNRKNIYCFDDLKKYNDLVKRNILSGLNVFSSNELYKNFNVIDNNLGSLNVLSIPTVAICGTSPRQGKFTLQLGLRRELKKSGYKFSQFGTEPSSYLFGFDKMFPSGYGIDLNGNIYKQILTYNKLLSSIEKDSEIMILGTQSQTIPYSFNNLNFLSFEQESLLIASQPDLIYLVINSNDDINFIKRTILYLENYLNSYVGALILYPYQKNSDWVIFDKEEKSLSDIEIEIVKEKLYKRLGKPILINGKFESIYNHMIEYFCER